MLPDSKKQVSDIRNLLFFSIIWKVYGSVYVIFKNGLTSIEP
jgi:hypothetical protein